MKMRPTFARGAPRLRGRRFSSQSPIGDEQAESTAVAEQRQIRYVPDTRALLQHHWRQARQIRPGLGELPETLLTERVDQRSRVLDPGADAYDDWENLYTAANFPFIVGIASEQIIPANPRRVFLLIQNKSAGNLFVSFGISADAFNGIQLSAGASLTFDGGERGGACAPGNSIHVLGGGANLRGVICEGVKLMIPLTE